MRARAKAIVVIGRLHAGVGATQKDRATVIAARLSHTDRGLASFAGAQRFRVGPERTRCRPVRGRAREVRQPCNNGMVRALVEVDGHLSRAIVPAASGLIDRQVVHNLPRSARIGVPARGHNRAAGGVIVRQCLLNRGCVDRGVGVPGVPHHHHAVGGQIAARANRRGIHQHSIQIEHRAVVQLIHEPIVGTVRVLAIENGDLYRGGLCGGCEEGEDQGKRQHTNSERREGGAQTSSANAHPH